MEIKGEKIYYLFNLCVHDKTDIISFDVFQKSKENEMYII